MDKRNLISWHQDESAEVRIFSISRIVDGGRSITLSMSWLTGAGG